MTLKKILANLLTLMVALVASLIFGELMIRAFAPQQLVIRYEDIWMLDPELEWKHRPNVKQEVNTGERTALYISNRLGQRVPSEGYGEDYGAFEARVLVIGDSFLEALAVDYGDSIPGLLHHDFRKKFNRNVYFANTAVAGYDPKNYYLVARRELGLRNYQLGLVFVYLENDILTSFRRKMRPRNRGDLEFRMPTQLSKQQIIDRILLPFNEKMETVSHLYVFLRFQFRVILGRFGLGNAIFEPLWLKSDVASPRWAATSTMLKKVEDQFRNHSTPLVFILLPASFQVYPDVFMDYIQIFDIDESQVDLEQPNRLLTEHMKTEQIESPIVDLLKLLRTQSTKTSEVLYGRVDRHLSPRGHQVVADSLVPIIAPYLTKNSTQ